ncbi:MAG: DUF378 domain-containing protein [Candidatus Liptonbacteria bacterium CG11_big_fil_rev_8_21_14_0_20_35_14]|uniref:DUF378 domain-containing protein n=1 Tax=Candidatus Liptonbacteria bacterium CG11_big_fil_rev_8_21_14_0_20_35_14 TaxID=1974634 RepID=A0A2H0N8M6_9BACT|nr:MAG: DUF378 domain-containing protein [Candidatus Liptonbacteria bacterium CG11_big_fil_rev_8_21_14_0_20_35_14]
MKKLGGLDLIALILVIVGGLNWGLVGINGWNLVEGLGLGVTVTKIVYDLVGLSALYLIIIIGKLGKK